MVVKRLFENRISSRSARDDQPLAGDDHPAAVLTADRIDAADARDGVAGIDLVKATAALDQRAAIGDVAQHPAVDRRQPADLGLGCGGAGTGAAAAVATWVGAIEPVVSRAGTAAAACAGAAGGVARLFDAGVASMSAPSERIAARSKDVAKLSDVAGPVILPVSACRASRVRPADGRPKRPADLLQKRLGQRHDVGRTFAQRRNLDVEDR